MSIEVVVSDEQLRALVQILTAHRDKDDLAIIADLLATLEKAAQRRKQ